MPNTSMPKYFAVLTTALMQAFMPGASPPLVKTPILFITLILRTERKPPL